MKRIKSATLTVTLLLLAGCLSVPLWADDTEIYLNTYADAGQPNILFVLDLSGSMNEALESDGSKIRSRYDVMQEVLEDVLDTVPDSVNVGLLTYGGHNEPAQANGIRYPVSPLDTQSGDAGTNVRQGILDELQNLEPEGYTPIVQSLYEAALYFRGDVVDYGATGKPNKLAHPASYIPIKKPSVPTECPSFTQVYCTDGDSEDNPPTQCDSVSGVKWNDQLCSFVGKTTERVGTCIKRDEAERCLQVAAGSEKEVTSGGYWQCKVCDLALEGRYRTPIKKECQSSYMVLMSDGEPDDGLSGSDPVILEKLNNKFNINACGETGDGRCGPELTRRMATTDQIGALEGEQTIKTYTVSFAGYPQGSEQEVYLRKLANLGKDAPEGAGAYTANNRQQLQEVFTNIVTNIAVANHDLAIPSISVDPKTGLTHGNEVFFPYFRPGVSPRWPGNLKKYRIERTGDDPEGKSSKLEVVDAEGNPVYDENGDQIAGTRSFWLPEGDPADGGNITAGGAARLLGDGRKIFTLDGRGHLIELNSDSVEPQWFGDEVNETESKSLVGYAYGRDPDLQEGQHFRREMGDILHSSPVLVNYDNGEDLIFVGTNEGFLHAFNTQTGLEKFSFIPKELLPVLKVRKENEFGVPHPYGIDGEITVWRDFETVNADDDPTGKTLLVVGMRRGGLNYYALDITNPDAPSVAWVIRGGDHGTVGFESLGQTWSKALYSVVEMDGKKQPAFIFSGGYDPQYDMTDPEGDLSDKIQGGSGGALFVVNARTGEKIWETDFGGNAKSMPASPRVIDIDNNGVADRIYGVDIEGHVFRVDLADSGNSLMLTKATEPQHTLLADLGGDDGEPGMDRRFYNEPDAALIVDNGNRFVALSLGSGYRAHPLMKGGEVAQDYLFSIKDPNVYQLPATTKKIIPEDLVELTNLNPKKNDASQTTSANGSQITPSTYGWKLPLSKQGGEKALARAVTLKNVVYFTTFEPETTPAADACSNASHTGRVYGLDVRSGKPALRFVDVTESGDIEEKLSVAYDTSDIPSEVVLVASGFRETVAGSKEVRGVKFDMLGQPLKGLESPSFSGLNKWYWEAAE